MRAKTLVVMTAVLNLALAANAGGPLAVGSPTFGVDGQPFVWDNSQAIQYRTDSGTLGSMSNSTANTHLQSAFSAWTSVTTAKISTTRVGNLLGVTNGHVSSVADFNTVYGSCMNGNQSPIVYDSNGSIFSQLIGDASVIGFTSLCKLSSDGHIRSALIVLTGGAGLSSTQQDQVMKHEIGHFFGLDHSLPGQNPCGTSTDDLAALPIMYYQLSAQTSLSADDKAWISMLYPSSSFNSVYGVITGQVLFSDGKNAVQDVLVAAHPANPSSNASENRAIAVSSISGYRFTGNPGQAYTADYLACTPATSCPHGYYGNNQDGSQFGSRNPALLGWYELPLPAGSYAIEISNINDGGTIGPNDPTIPLPGPGEYWNPQESANDADFSQIECTVPQVLNYVTVTAGNPTNNINFIMNGTAPPFDIFEQGAGGSASLRSLFQLAFSGRGSR
ncbi:MAG TPA: M12 family metallo-peptidase [Terriglobales bacterium]|nr:M12 family metallo-peptidase [Terriglobales bacterium]